ncbi:metallophosphoesterase [Promethearchaeum syntrophicum]|uniref:Metallophosphoesterase n=1 Tax=Promethearchaeum syntrophicum TaxID=2594042 RepID=A0A5B9DF83_9ARCH|nr:metallophosphoesterase [Candidatus Prometheoarchaeum syntrophicum]QEE17443.1 cyclic 3',5'-adenosine monophosphate phosphodiesterase [Candidatus Prometheoarchaeum syntrophicum]
MTNNAIWENPKLLGIPPYKRYEMKLPQTARKGFHKRIILISDTHISTDNNPSLNSVMLRKGIEEIDRYKDVDYVIHLGDLTHDGTYLEYQQSLDLIRRLNKDNFYIIPGNHDARNVGDKLFEEFFGSRQFEIEDEDLYIFGVDSSLPDRNTGRIGKMAILRSEENFLAHQDKIKIFCFHHQLIPIPHTGRERSAVFDGGDALEMALRTNVDIILNGHRHITNIYSCSDGNSDLLIFNCGTLSANKTRYKEMFSYTVLDINEKTVKFTTKKLLDGSFLERWRYISQKYQQPQKISIKPINTLIHMGVVNFGEGLFLPDIFDDGCRQVKNYNPNLICMTGSLTGHNKVSEYQFSKEKLAAIECPMLLLPGFQDLQKYGWDRYAEFMGSLDPKYNSERLRVYGLNAIDQHLTDGAVGRSRMYEICKYFKETNDKKLNILACNHRFLPSPKLIFETILEDSGSVLKNFTNRENKIKLILMGRNNSSYSLQIEDTVLSYCGSFCSQNVVISNHHSFNVIKTYENGLTQVYEHCIETNSSKLLGQFWQ